MSKHYVIDENHNFVEAYSAQEVLSVLEQAIADGSLANVVAGQAIIDKLKCCVTGGTTQVAFITMAKYNELAGSNSIKSNTLYYITDDTTFDDIDAILADLNSGLQSVTETVDKVVNGDIEVPKASHASTADNATNASNATTADSATKASSATTANNANNAYQATILNPEWLMPNDDGNIPISEMGVYVAIMKNDKDMLSTAVITVLDWGANCYSTVLGDGSTHVYYDESKKCLVARNATSSNYTMFRAYRIV